MGNWEQVATNRTVYYGYFYISEEGRMPPFRFYGTNINSMEFVCQSNNIWIMFVYGWHFSPHPLPPLKRVNNLTEKKGTV